MRNLNIFTVLAAAAALAFALKLAGVGVGLSRAESAAPQETSAQEVSTPAAERLAAEKTEQKEEGEKKKDETLPPEASSPPPYGERGFSGAEIDVLQSLAQRREELDQREQQIAQREALLKVAEDEVDRKIAELSKVRSELESLLEKQQKLQDERVSSLVKIYEGMKPKEAARIFDALDMEILLPVISKMSERKSSPILASMDPDKARQVTVRLTELHKLPSLPESGKKDAGPPALDPPSSINLSLPPAPPAEP